MIFDLNHVFQAEDVMKTASSAVVPVGRQIAVIHSRLNGSEWYGFIVQRAGARPVGHTQTKKDGTVRTVVALGQVKTA